MINKINDDNDSLVLESSGLDSEEDIDDSEESYSSDDI